MVQRLQRAVVGAALFYVQALAWAQLPAQAQAGDLIFRRGTEAVSHMVRAVDQGLFSHVGMLVGQAGAWQVIHATPSERPGRPDAVVLDSLAFFVAPERAHTFAIYHLAQASAQQRQAAVQWALAQQGRPFAMQETGAGIYCTTLVWQAWQRLGLDWQVRFTPVDIPWFRGKYLLPSALAASPQLQLLKSEAIYADKH